MGIVLDYGGVIELEDQGRVKVVVDGKEVGTLAELVECLKIAQDMAEGFNRWVGAPLWYRLKTAFLGEKPWQEKK